MATKLYVKVQTVLRVDPGVTLLRELVKQILSSQVHVVESSFSPARLVLMETSEDVQLTLEQWH